MKLEILLLLSLAGASCVGCGSPQPTFGPGKENGLVMILPGIEGQSPINEHIRQGLLGAGVNCDVQIHQWGSPIPVAKLLINETDVLGNRRAAKRVAEIVGIYLEQFPDRPVFLVGHSGGAGIAVFALEALAESQKEIDGAALLSGSISSKHALGKALDATREGIVNFYNPKDVALLGVGTTLVGNVDGTHDPSAGRVGFQAPAIGNLPAGRRGKLYQVEITADMVDDPDQPHVADTSRQFVAQYLSPWITDRGWPPHGHGGMLYNEPAEKP